MHDPKTVAFEIRYPFKNKSGYRSSFITIWHNDPLNFRFPDGTRKQGRRSDDSCGWSTPMYHEQEWADLKKVAIHQYSELFARQVAEKEGKDYAYICNQPESTYEIVYWIWRAIKAHGKKGWQYGRRRNFLSAAELEFIMVLATAPGDNFKQHHKPHDEESFVDMFRMIWNQYRRFHRPWYKHPRWHVHHWSIQFHPWQQLKRRYWDKCCICGKRGFTGPAYGNWNDDRIWHGECANARKEAVTGINPIQ
ncbi:hypothetical protein [Spirosoma sordidisoli]|nr:hypothetical protein [Spirosoma sordidisoli]